MPASLLLVLSPLTVPKALWICAHKHVWSIVFSSGLPRTGEMWSYWRGQRVAAKMIKGLELLSYEEKLRAVTPLKGGSEGISSLCMNT